VIGLLLVGVIDSHNWLSWPVSRVNQRQTETGCRLGGEGNPTCAGPCDKTVAQMSIAPVTAQRGQTLQINWNRHTHPWGFVRFAWSPTSQSDNPSSFDSRVDRIVCKEIGGCGPSDPSDPSGGTNGIDCATTITVPEYLTDGAWTLQWAYFGGWYNAGDYYACVDYTISGGPSSSSQPSPFYVGGDYTYPNQDVCLFYSTNALHVCVVEPCTTGTFPAGDQHGPAAGFSSAPPSSVTTGKITTGQHAVTTSKITTGHQVTTGITSQHVVTTGVHAVTTAKPPVTTGHQPITTGQHLVTTGQHQVTTGQHSVTTASHPAITTGAKQSITTASHNNQVTTASNNNNGGITTSDSNALCYLPGTPYLDGPINSNPPTCGSNSNPHARCQEGLCCSQYGYCGPIADSKGRYFEEVHGRYTHVTAQYAFSLYCNKTQGDYRKVPCNSIDGSDDLNKDAGSGIRIGIQMELLFISFISTYLFFFLF